MRTNLLYKTVYVIAVIFLWSQASACTRKDPNIGKVVQAAKLFNERFNSSQFKEIYADADPRLRNSIGEIEFTSKLSELFKQHGSIKSTSVNGLDAMTRW